MVLAILSCIGGFLGLSSLFSHHHFIDHFFTNVLFNKPIPHPTHFFELVVLIVSVVVLAIIIFTTRRYYVSKENIPVTPEQETGLAKVLSNKYYLDEIYQTLILKPIEWVSGFAFKIIDKTIIDGVVNFSGKGVNFLGSTLRKVQTGNIEFYLMAMVFGVISFLILYQLI